jgi:hypothetical protein
VLHATVAGSKTVSFPSRCDVYDYFAGKWHTGVTQVTVNASLYQTFYFFYGKQAPLRDKGIG